MLLGAWRHQLAVAIGTGSLANPDLGNNNAAIVFGDNAPRGGRRASPNNNTLAFVFGNNSTALASPANPTVIGSGDNVSKP